MKALKQLLTGTDPKPKGSYAITSGTYIGEFFVYMEKIMGKPGRPIFKGKGFYETDYKKKHK